MNFAILGTGRFAEELLGWIISSGRSSDKFHGFFGKGSGRTNVYADSALPLFSGELFVGVNDPAVKERLSLFLEAINVRPSVFVHPSAVVAEGARVSLGSVVCPNVVVGNNAELGAYVTVNYLSGIGHHSALGNYSSLAPGVQVGGSVKLGERCRVGLNASVVDGVTLSNDVVLSPGSVVMRSLRNPGTYFGVPARKFFGG